MNSLKNHVKLTLYPVFHILLGEQEKSDSPSLVQTQAGYVAV